MVVVHARLAFDTDYLSRSNLTDRFEGHERAHRFRLGTLETEFMPQVAPISGELIVNKGGVDPFAATALEVFLRSRGIANLVLAGVATNYVVESAARYAGDRGFRVSVIGDACASYSEEMHSFAIHRTLPVFANVLAAKTFVENAEASG